MNSQKNPGSNSWEVVRKLGKGGQGETSLVKSISPPEREGVLKALKNNKSEQARARMRREVSNLDTLSFQGVKVPAVIESNTDRFKESGVPLYFIMQFVDGCTLDEIVVQQRPLSLERAAAMVLDLGTTMSAAHRQCVFHRDLKPANIIVRNADAADLVIVDYGLSFNVEDDEETVTETSDRFRNEFLALGETNTPGGNKRDARIDVTALCAVLYFCLTGQVPGQLADGRGRAPHRRDGVHSVRNYISDHDRCNQVEMLLDRGFAPDIERRFQTCAELSNRLREVLDSPRDKPQNPADLAAFLGQQLMERDRKTQLQQQKAVCINLINRLQKAFLMKHYQKLGAFGIVATGTPEINSKSIPLGFEHVGAGIVYSVSHILHGSREIRILFGAEGNQTVMLGQLAMPGPEVPQTAQFSPNCAWKKVLWFSPEALPSDDVFVEALERYLNDAMTELFNAAIRQ